MINPMNLKGKKILVTGASSGIGRAVCVTASRLGADVVLSARNEERLNETVGLMEAGNHKIVPCDFLYPESIEDSFNSAGITPGEIDGIVYSAGKDCTRPLRRLTNNVLIETMQVNTFSFIELVRIFSSRQKTGSIVYISSVTGTAGEKALTAYCASKAAGEAAVRCLAQELAGLNVRVNSVAPSFINTGMYDSFIDKVGEPAYNEIIKRQYMGIGQPDDVANAACYLLSDASRFMTGTTLFVDGGYTSHGV